MPATPPVSHPPLRPSLPPGLTEMPVVPVLRADHADAYHPVVEVLLEQGMRVVELTLTTPDTLQVLPDLVKRWGTVFGVGTVTSEGEAEAAIAAGAAFLVTPVADVGVVRIGVAAGLPVIPGGLTPTELFSLWSAGASAVKVFPAQTVGPSYGAHLQGPFPDLAWIPSGGVALSEVSSWMDAGAVAVSLGGPLLGDSLRGGSLDDLAARTRQATVVLERWKGVR